MDNSYCKYSLGLVHFGMLDLVSQHLSREGGGDLYVITIKKNMSLINLMLIHPNLTLKDQDKAFDPSLGVDLALK
jgi:hypothetical protein